MSRKSDLKKQCSNMCNCVDPLKFGLAQNGANNTVELHVVLLYVEMKKYLSTLEPICTFKKTFSTTIL